LDPNILSEAAQLLGDPHPLLSRMGAPDAARARGLTPGGARFDRIRSVAGLKTFLDDYRSRLLEPVELPVIKLAYEHGARNEARELIALDRQMASEPALKEFAAASCRVGQRQLNRLRPLRDQRLIQRYRAAIEQGEAHGWHTLVYGVALATFSLPLRQGLIAYAGHTLSGFISGAAGPLALTIPQCRELELLAVAPAPDFVQRLLAAGNGAALRLV